MIFLDTDILVDYFRKYIPCVEWLESQNSEIYISGYTCIELYAGCKNKIEILKLEKFFKNVNIIWLNEDSLNLAMNSFKEFYISHGIGIFDCFIGHSALQVNKPIYSFNEKHYKKINGLTVRKPYKK